MKNVIIKKFGGTSLNDLSRVAHIVKSDVKKGYHVVVVVSAASGFTDQMAFKAQQISDLNCQKELSEYDVLLSAGEQISCGLLAITLRSMGVNAKSWLAWQLPIITDEYHSASRIKEIKIDCLQKSFSEGNAVAIIAGFQGVCNNRLTTLGRGGSDISAVALAVAFNVKTCEIFTDVNGIYTADPKIVSQARRLESISYDEMLEMSLSGAKILHNRSVQIAMKHNIKLQVLSTFQKAEGTAVLPNHDVLEKHLVTGITYSTNEVFITFTDLTVQILKKMVDEKIRIDMVNNTSLVISKCDVDRAKKLLGKSIHTINDNIAKISIIGIGVVSNIEVMCCVLNVLERNKIEMLAISTSEIRISIIIKKEYAEVLLNDLHTSLT